MSRCEQDLAINSLYGAKRHLKTSETHIRKQGEYDNKKNQDNVILEDSREIKPKLFEYDLCNLIVKENLPFSHVEAVLNLMKKHTKSQVVINSKFNRHKAAE